MITSERRHQTTCVPGRIGHTTHREPRRTFPRQKDAAEARMRNHDAVRLEQPITHAATREAAGHRVHITKISLFSIAAFQAVRDECQHQQRTKRSSVTNHDVLLSDIETFSRADYDFCFSGTIGTHHTRKNPQFSTPIGEPAPSKSGTQMLPLNDSFEDFSDNIT